MTTPARAAICRGHDHPFTIEPVTLADLRPDELLVRIVACGICHTDLAVRDAQLPVPNTAIGSPARTCIALSTAPAPVISPQPIGARRASGRPAALSGTRTTLRWWAIAWVANADWPKKLAAIGSPASVMLGEPSARAPDQLCGKKL